MPTSECRMNRLNRVIPAQIGVIPAQIGVIPAQAGIHAGISIAARRIARRTFRVTRHNPVMDPGSEAGVTSCSAMLHYEVVN